MPIIVVDGCDVTGKSTIVDALRQLVPHSRSLHLTYRWPGKMDLYHLAAFRWATRHNATLAILDRWWPSEYVYAGVYREGSKFPLMRRLLDRVALRYGVLYCITHRADRDVQASAHLASSKEREEMYASDEKIKQLHDWYVKLYQQNSHRRDWRAYNLDLQGGHLAATCSNLYDQVLSLAFMEATHPFQDYVGTRFADYLFVGDVANSRGHHLGWPWFSYIGASATMAQGLEEVGIGEERCMWTNVNSVKVPNEEHQRQLSQFLKGFNGQVVALGNVARDFLGQRAHYELPHPAYVARFKGKETMASYLEALK